MTALQAPAATDVAVHWWQLAGNSTDSADLAILGPSERERLDRIQHPAQAAEFVGSRAGVRRILAELLGVTPGAVALGRLPCPGCGAADHGPPAVLHPRSPFRISLSHASGRCLLAVAQVPVGIDIEAERPLNLSELARVALTATEHRQLLGLPAGAARERAFLRCWTRKEAALKALGTGIATDLSRIETHPDRRGPVTVTAGPPGTARDWSVHDVTVPGPWVATAAVPYGVSARVTVSQHPGVH
ncbi:4'-phosphopantetheinyl transferase family protein [Streptomyces griseus]|uniref:4'-phosphopantetheinyl transferase family protein n=1 Tax=Streptomyces griseus TaxID=1911 RepID=UPI0037A04846